MWPFINPSVAVAGSFLSAPDAQSLITAWWESRNLENAFAKKMISHDFS